MSSRLIRNDSTQEGKRFWEMVDLVASRAPKAPERASSSTNDQDSNTTPRQDDE